VDLRKRNVTLGKLEKNGGIKRLNSGYKVARSTGFSEGDSAEASSQRNRTSGRGSFK
jgi:hypothetical protein